MIFYVGFLIPFLEFFFDKVFPKLAIGFGALLLIDFIWNALGPVIVVAAIIAAGVFIAWRMSKRGAEPVEAEPQA